MRILVTCASRHGATQVIATVVGHTLEDAGHVVDLVPVSDVADVEEYDAVVVGSGVYARHWMPEALAFVRRHARALAARPVWLFSSGPLSPPGPAGWAGQDARELPELQRLVGPRGHALFPGALDPASLGFGERLSRRLHGRRAALPEGDFRDWDEVRAWARGVDVDVRHSAQTGPNRGSRTVA